MDRDELIGALRAALEAGGAVELAILFGSRARGEASERSDVDLAVLSETADRIGLSVELERIVGAAVDVTDLRGAPYPLLLEVLRDGVRVFEKTPGTHGRFVAHALAELETNLPNLRRMQQGFVEHVAAHGLAPAEE